IEKIHLAGTAVHEELYDRLGACAVVRRPGFEIIKARRGGGQSGICVEQIVSQEISQRRALQTVGHSAEKTAAVGFPLNRHIETPLNSVPCDKVWPMPPNAPAS